MKSKRRASRSPLLGKHAASGTPLRTLGFPDTLVEPLFLWRDDAQLKANRWYAQAKAGETFAAIELTIDVGEPLAKQVGEMVLTKRWPEPLIFVAPHAREARGDNAIPQVLAVLLSFGFGEVDEQIVQTTKVYHTGADAMERLIARASFLGPV